MNLNPHQSQQELRETEQAHKSDSIIFEVVCAALILYCEQEQLCLASFQYLPVLAGRRQDGGYLTASPILAVRYSKQSISGAFLDALDISLPMKCDNP